LILIQGKVGIIILIVGDFTYGHDSIQLMSWDEGTKLVIGKYCSIAQNVRVFLGGNHNSGRVSTYPFGHINQEIFGDRKLPGHPLTNGDVVIGNDVWIGYGVTIMSGVSIGSGAVIAANSHVIKDVPSYEIWGGNPAQPIRSRFPSEIKERLLEINWWDYSVEKVIEVEELLQQTPSIKTLVAIEKILKV
jgi:acetyltransferase-like isoleucine patch superfamily enzyme